MFRTSFEGSRPRLDWRAVALLAGGLLFVYYLVPILALLTAQNPLSVLRQFESAAVVTAATHSVLTALASTGVATAFGVPLAYLLARSSFRGKWLVTTVLVLPLVLPPIVSGILLLRVFGPNALGGPAAALGVPLTRSLVGVVLAQTFVASPFVVLTAKAAFEGVDAELEAASRTLGKDAVTTMRRVTLPLARPGILAGVTLAFARSMGEFGATIMLAYYPRTMPVQIWVSYLSTGLDAALPIAVVLLVLSLVVLLALTVAGTNPWG